MDGSYDPIAQPLRPVEPRALPRTSTFYVEEAHAAGGPVVELGVGTGRIAVPIAQAGIDVIGVDSSAGHAGRRPPAAARPGVADRSTCGSATCASRLSTSAVPLVTCPFRAYLHMQDDAERLARPARGAPPARPRRPVRLRRLRAGAGRHRGDRTGAGSSASPASSSAPTGTPPTRTLTLSVRSGRAPERRWRSHGSRRRSGARCSSAGGFGVEALLRLVRPAGRTPGGEDSIWIARRPPSRVAPMIWVVVIIVAVLASCSARCSSYLYNKLVRLRNRTRERVGAGRRPAPAPLRPDPEPRRDGQGLRGARARDVRGGDASADAPPSRRRPCRSRRRRRTSSRPAIGRLFAVAEAYPELRATENFQQLQAELDGHREQDRRRAPGLQRHRADLRQRASRPCRRTSSPGSSTSSRGRTSRSRTAGTGGAARPVLVRRRATAAARRALARSRRSLLAPRPRPPVVRAPSAPTSGHVEPDGGAARRGADHVLFSGAFTGAYRDIPLREGESVDRDLRRRGRRALPPGSVRGARQRRARRERSASPRPTTRVRVVWHFRASSARRGRSRSRYRIRGPRGRLRRRRRRQPEGLGRRVGGRRSARLTRRSWLPRSTALGRATAPGAHPVWVRGDVTLDAGRARACRAVDVPPKQFVELRVVFPREAARLDGGRAGRDGRRPRTRSSRRSRGRGRATSATGEQIDDALDNLGADGRSSCSLLGARPRRSLLVGAVYWRLRPRAPHRLRPRVRAGAAVGARAGARPAAAAAERPAWARTSSRPRSST